MQPIATPDTTIDSTIDSSAVTGSQVERAVLERISLDHHHFVVRVSLELVEIADDLIRLGAHVLHRLGDHPWTVVAERDPPQKRVAHVDLRALQTVEEGDGAIRKLAARGVANRAE